MHSVEITDFHSTQILREFNFGHFEAPKNAILAAQNFEFLGIIDTFKFPIPNNQNSKPPKVIKWQFLTF